MDRGGGGTERLRRRVMAAYVAIPSHEKTYLSAASPGTSGQATLQSQEELSKWYKCRKL